MMNERWLNERTLLALGACIAMTGCAAEVGPSDDVTGITGAASERPAYRLGPDERLREPDDGDSRVYQVSEPVTGLPIWQRGREASPTPRITGVSPSAQASVHARVTLTGEHLPTVGSGTVWGDERYLDIYFGSERLEVIERSSTEVTVVLPGQAGTGDLYALFFDEELGAEETLLWSVGFEVTSPWSHFDADGDGYSWQEAYLMSVLSWLAYFEPDVVADEAPHWGVHFHADRVVDEVSDGFPAGSTQAYLFSTDEMIVVAVRGTQTVPGDARDVRTDTDLRRTDVSHYCPGSYRCNLLFCGHSCDGHFARVHSGFLQASQLGLPVIATHVEALLDEDPRPVWITGHSLGGAVASLTAFLLDAEHAIAVQGVHTFGAPAIGNQTFANEFHRRLPVDRVHRWSIQSDPAVAILGFPYVHLGTNNNLYDSGQHAWDAEDFVGNSASAALHWQALGDPEGPHMDYWCRLYEELVEHTDLEGDIPEPPALADPMCRVEL